MWRYRDWRDGARGCCSASAPGGGAGRRRAVCCCCLLLSAAVCCVCRVCCRQTKASLHKMAERLPFPPPSIAAPASTFFSQWQKPPPHQSLYSLFQTTRYQSLTTHDSATTRPPLYTDAEDVRFFYSILGQLHEGPIARPLAYTDAECVKFVYDILQRSNLENVPFPPPSFSCVHLRQLILIGQLGSGRIEIGNAEWPCSAYALQMV